MTSKKIKNDFLLQGYQLAQCTNCNYSHALWISLNSLHIKWNNNDIAFYYLNSVLVLDLPWHWVTLLSQPVSYIWQYLRLYDIRIISSLRIKYIRFKRKY